MRFKSQNKACEGWQTQQKRPGTSVALFRWSGPKKVSDEVQEERQTKRHKISTHQHSSGMPKCVRLWVRS